MMSLSERLERKTDKSGDCWVWTGSKIKKGYGTITVRQKPKPRTFYAHRVAYELYCAAIPDGHEVDHLCNNPSCVRPSHLEAKTGRENNARSNSLSARYSRRDACSRGHHYNMKNTRLREYKPGLFSRQCRTCDREDAFNRRHPQAA